MRKQLHILFFVSLSLILPQSALGLSGNRVYTQPNFDTVLNNVTVQTRTKYLPLSTCIPRDLANANSPSNIYRAGVENLTPKNPIRVLIFYVDFPEIRSSAIDTPVINTIKTQISKYYFSMSEGLMHFDWTESRTVSRLPLSILEYHANSRENLTSISQIIRDAQNIALKNYNLKEFDFFIVVPPSVITSEDISTSITILKSDFDIINSTILAGDFWKSGGSWTIPAHEIGHALGLLDLYSYKSANNSSQNVTSYIKQFQFMGFYDLMNWPTGPAPEFSGWNRWLLGFLKSKEVRCLPLRMTVTEIDALESNNQSIKALLFKVNDSELVVIENRQPIGFDRDLPKSASGVIVYTVNLLKKSGEGPLRLEMPYLNRKLNRYYNLRAGFNVTLHSLKVSCISYTKGQALVSVQGI